MRTLSTFLPDHCEIEQNVTTTSNHPGVRTVFNLGPWIAFLPRIPYVTVPKKESWSRRYGVFEDYGVDIVSYVSQLDVL